MATEYKIRRGIIMCMHLTFGHLWYKPTCTHQWVLFTSFANVMTGRGCTQYDESSKFIIVKGIIILKHNSERIANHKPIDKARHHAASCTTGWETRELVSCEAGLEL